MEEIHSIKSGRGMDIQLTQEVQVLPQESKGCIRFYLNRSVVLGPIARMQIKLPYQLIGCWGLVWDGLSMPGVVFHVKLQTDGVIFGTLQNLENMVIHITAGRCVCIMQGCINQIFDIDGFAVGRKLSEVRTITKDHQDMSSLAELKSRIEESYSKVFAEGKQKMTPKMQRLAVGKRDFHFHQKVPWTSEARWQPMSLVQEKELQKELVSLEERGIIEEIAVNVKCFASQALVFYKPNNKGVRVTLDCRKINKYVETWTCPLPPVKTVVSRINPKWKFFSVLDVKDGFFNIPLQEDIRKYFCFMAGGKMYQYCRLVQGFNGSACLFHSLLGRIISGLGAIHYVDDILIGGSNQYEHDIMLHKVLCRLQDYGFRIKAEKMQLKQERVEYLGHGISQGLMDMEPYIRRLREKMPRITGRKTLQKGIGMLNVMRNHVHDHANKLSAFYQYVADIGKQEDWEQVNEHFQRIMEEMMVNNIKLSMQEMNNKFEVYTDWSKESSGFILMSQGRPIWMGSRIMQGWKRHHSSFLGEAKAVKWALQQCQWIVQGCQVTVYTDSMSSLQSFLNPRKWIETKDCRLSRIMSFLVSNYSIGNNLRFEHIAGKDNVIADALSRWKLDQNCEKCSIHAVDSVIQRMTWRRWMQVIHKGHYGLKVTKMIIQELGLDIPDSFVQGYLDNCLVCQRFSKKGSGVKYGRLARLTHANQLVGMDAIGPLPKSKTQDYEYIVTMIDHFSKYVVVMPVKSVDWKAVVAGLEIWNRNFGNPQVLLTDGAKVFCSQRVENWCRKQNVGHLFTAPYAHHSAGVVERMHRNLESRMKRIMCAQSKGVKEWDEVLQEAAGIINATPSMSTGHTPLAVFRRINHAGEWIEDERYEEIRIGVMRKIWHDQNVQQDKSGKGQSVVFHKYDYVWMLDHQRRNRLGTKLMPIWGGPGIFLGYVSPHRVLVRYWEQGRWKEGIKHIEFIRKVIGAR